MFITFARPFLNSVEILVKNRQRLMALFFVAVMVSATLIPSGQVWAEAQQRDRSQKTTHDLLPDAAKDKVKKDPNASKPMKTNYDSALPTIDTPNVPAADYKSREAKELPSILASSKVATSLSTEGLQSKTPAQSQTFKKEEIVSKRTPNSTTFRNEDGSYTTKEYGTSKFYKNSKDWLPINTALLEDKNSGDADNFLGEMFGSIQALVKSPEAFTVKENDWQARFAPSGSKQAMVRIKKGSDQIGFSPVGAKEGVIPTISEDSQGRQTVHYYDLWPGVNVEYEVKADTLKENIVLKNRSASANFRFKVSGTKLSKPSVSKADSPAYMIDGALGKEFVIAPLSVSLNTFGHEDAGKALQHSFDGDILSVSLQKNYLDQLPDKAFPVIIDPTTTRNQSFGTRTGGAYVSFKSDGYVCPDTTCNPMAGAVLDSSSVWRNWRGMMYSDYHEVKGRQLNSATFHFVQREGLPVSGTTAPKTLTTWHATCFDYSCKGVQGGSAVVGTVGNIDVTGVYQSRINANDYDSWLMVTGEETAATSYKNIDPDFSYIQFVFTDVLPSPTILTPTNNQVFVDPQVSFAANANMVNPATGTPLQYEFCVSTGPGCGGAVMVSNQQVGPMWTIPDGILQDGTTYYVQSRVFDPVASIYGSFGVPVTFKIDNRTGKDSTQAYDTLGPVSVDLATGNATTSSASHTVSALGGSMGVSLDYNSPVKSRRGLVGKYWNVATNYAGGIPATAPNLTRVDQTVDFNWATGSPAANVINNDWYFGLWEGYFVAPSTGTYYFGSSNDDTMTIKVNNTQLFSGSCYTGVCYNGTIALTAGQIVPVQVQYTEATAHGYAKLYVKGAVPEQVVRSDWLQTGARPTAQQNGLTGRYYRDPNLTHNFNDANNTLMMQRTDQLISFDWQTGAAIPGGPMDRFMVRWTGYITAPTTGTYEFGTVSDDGSRVTMGTNNTPVVNKWYDDGGTPAWGAGYVLTAGVPTPITVDMYENAGGAGVHLKVRGASGTVLSEQIVPTTWLSTGASILPNGWSMGIDADGNVSYDHLKITQNSVTLTDSTGSNHEYIWDASKLSYKPPINEDGTLIRNADATYTFQDTDGRTYVFNTDGTLASLTSPTDDLKPVALKYEYGGTPSHLTKITDGTTSGRWAKVFYYGDTTNCPIAVTGFDAPSTLTGKLCAVTTSDSRTTAYYYKDGNLGRIQEPGSEITDYQYDTLGRIVSVRDVAANDAIAAAVRTNDANLLTSVAYDDLSRVAGVTQPAATAGATRTQHTVNYKQSGAGVWQPTRPISGLASTPVAISWGGDRMDLFARGTDNALKHAYTEDGVTWSAWEDLGGCMVENPAVASWSYGRLDVLVQNCNATGNNLSHRAFSNGAWAGWGAPTVTTSRIVGSPSVVSWGHERIDYAFRGTNNELYIGAWSPASGWVEGGSHGGCLASSPALTSSALYRLEIYTVGCAATGDNVQSHKYDGASWTGFVNETGVRLNTVAASYDKTVGLIVAGRDTSNALRYRVMSDTSWQVRVMCISDVPTFASHEAYGHSIFYNGCTGGWQQETFRYPAGTTDQKIVGATEPNGFTRRLEYDKLFRTTKDTDIANLSDSTEWHPTKDLTLSTTDETGLKSTTIYDDDDRPVSQYGPAPASWFGVDRKPTASYVNQVARADTAYDENLKGSSVAYYGFAPTSKVLSGAPKLHTTNLSGSVATDFAKNYAATTPIPGVTDNWGLRATGKLRLPATGTYRFRIESDDGVRLFIDDKSRIDDWNNGAYRDHGSDAYENLTVNSLHRLRLEYYHTNDVSSSNDSNIKLFITAPGGTETSVNVNQYITPDYDLTTSSKVYDSTIGDVTSTTNYGATPELGLMQSMSVDPTGLNLTTSMTYETQGAAGSFLRQTSKTLPGGNATTYAHYTATGTTSETRDNPCTAGVTETTEQAGFVKLKTEPDPDGAGAQTGRKTETIYDSAGRVVATRINTDPWTCTTYDARGRVANTVIPDNDGTGPNVARTITNNYAVGGNPMVTSSGDVNGDITTTTDLLGRTTHYSDIFEDETDYTYDSLGRLITKVSPLGTEAFVYDNYSRLTQQKLDGTTLATPTYDAYGRLSNVTYNTAASMSLSFARDTLGRTSGQDYTLGNGTTHVADTVSRSQSGQIISGTENGSAKTYTYDKAGRLTAATLGSNSWSYGFGTTPGGQCAGTAGTNYNANAGKNANRTTTTQTVASVTTTKTYCYDNADRLISGTDPNVDQVTYDAHGNITGIGTSWNGKHTDMFYDSSDRNNGFWQNWGNDYDIYYERDVQNRIVSAYKIGLRTQDSWSGFTGSGDAPDFTRNANWDITEKYIQLPGGTLMTIRPLQTGNAQKTYSLSNIHGDVMVSTNAVGVSTGTFSYDPFGTPLNTTASPDNTTAGQTNSWVGQHQKMTDSDMALKPIQMGARIYLPGIGRFASVDSVEGGVENNYVYPPDPVNDFDLTGQFNVTRFVTNHSDLIIAAAGVAGCALTAGVGCAIITAAAIVSSGAIAYKQNGRTAAAKSVAFDAATVGLGSRIKLVRDFGVVKGNQRYYKSIKSAIVHKGKVNKQAIKRLGNQVLYTGGVYGAQKAYSWVRSKHR